MSPNAPSNSPDTENPATSWRYEHVMRVAAGVEWLRRAAETETEPALKSHLYNLLAEANT